MFDEPGTPSRTPNPLGAEVGLCGRQDLAPYCTHVRGLVSARRLEHIRRVAETAIAIAEANGLSEAQVEKVALAAVLHDAARDLAGPELIRLGRPTNELERSHPLTLHGRAARQLAQEWGVVDEEVLRAVEGHVFGVAPDEPVGMCVYVADVCEPGRGVNDGLLELAMHDLAAAYRQAVRTKVEYLRATGKPIHPDTLAIYRALSGGPPTTDDPAVSPPGAGL